jgi:hypothetical protein
MSPGSAISSGGVAPPGLAARPSGQAMTGQRRQGQAPRPAEMAQPSIGEQNFEHIVA